jgi:hypothetical protein
VAAEKKLSHLQVYVINHPVVQVLAEVHHAELLHHVQLSGPVKVENAVESARMAVKIELILFQGVCIT